MQSRMNGHYSTPQSQAAQAKEQPKPKRKPRGAKVQEPCLDCGCLDELCRAVGQRVKDTGIQ